MRVRSSAIQAALEAGILVLRDFAWVGGRDLETGDLTYQGFYSGLGTVSAPVIDPILNAEVTRTFVGGGAAFTRSPLTATSDMTIRTMRVGLSQINSAVADSVRGYNLRQAPIQLYEGTFSPTTRKLIEAAECVFVGVINNVEIITPKAGEVGSITLTLTSQLGEMTRANPDVRSGASQRNRSGGDSFYDWTQNVKGIPINWGRVQGPVK